jgi:hypothetical protein
MEPDLSVPWRLCNSTWARIVRRYGENANATDFDPTERPVVLVWTVTGIVGNGGFEYLFDCGAFQKLTGSARQK